MCCNLTEVGPLSGTGPRVGGDDTTQRARPTLSESPRVLQVTVAVAGAGPPAESQGTGTGSLSGIIMMRMDTYAGGATSMLAG